MRLLLLPLMICLMVPGIAFAANIEAQSVACTGDAYSGLPGGTGIAVFEVSGHGDTTIDGNAVAPAGTGTYQGYPAVWYPAAEGTHKILITSPGYYLFTSYMPVCDGRVSYIYYNKAAHPQPGTTLSSTTATTESTETTAETTTQAPASSQYSGQSADLKAALAAGRTLAPGSYGSISVTTDPAGASIYIDGLLSGVTPATIPGISAGSHTMVLKLDGYEDLTLPVTVAAGSTQYYSSAMRKSGAGAASAALPGPTTKKSPAPGCGIVLAAGMIAALLARRNVVP